MPCVDSRCGHKEGRRTQSIEGGCRPAHERVKGGNVQVAMSHQLGAEENVGYGRIGTLLTRGDRE